MMIRLFRFIFTGDSHLCKWEIIETADLENNMKGDAVVGKLYVLQCEHCGNIKKEQITI